MFFNDFIYLWLCKVFMLHGLSLAAASRDCSPVGAMGFSQRWLLLLQSMDSGAHRPQYCSSPAPEPRPRGCDTWAQLLCHVESSQARGGTRIHCFGRGAILYHWASRKALRCILDSGFPCSYLVGEAWELGVLSHSPGSAIKSSGASGECLPLPQSCLTLCDPSDRSPPGSSVHEISQARWGSALIDKGWDLSEGSFQISARQPSLRATELRILWAKNTQRNKRSQKEALSSLSCSLRNSKLLSPLEGANMAYFPNYLE